MNRKGQTLVEFVLILPLFIFILFAIFDFGRIQNKKSELENISTDVVSMIKNDNTTDEIKALYPDLEILIKEEDKYIVIEISEDVDVMTPGLNLVLGNNHKVTIERTIPNV